MNRGGECVSFHVRQVDDVSHPQSDYFAGFYVDNITQALEFIKPPPPKFPVGTLVRGKQTKRAIRHGFNGKVGIIGTVGTKTSHVYFDGSHLQRAVASRDLELVQGV